jgi:hypothetical protein
MDDDIKNSSIDDFIRKCFTPTKRNCMICDIEFIGDRSVCSDKCHFALQARVKYNRSLRSIDYQSVGRKTFIMEELPKCSICGQEYADLQEHCKEVNDDIHKILAIHNL